MAKNIIPSIARELGVEIGERFRVTDYGEEVRFVFNDDGLLTGYDNLERSYALDVLIDLIYGNKKVIKLPFEPVYNEQYWTYADLDFDVVRARWRGDAGECCRKASGCVFRTKKEAERARPQMYKELTGKEWVE